MKNFLFRHYIKIAVIGGAILVIFAVKFEPIPDWNAILTIIGGSLSFVYFVQKQKLEETRLLKALFTEFNVRYEALNERLNEILRGDPNRELNQEEVDTLYSYFNLCGEEYLFYKRGYIFPEVWEAWVNGMKIFYKDERIRRLWKRELETNSYYGFTLELLKE
jgi:hypothetical protein